MEDTPLNIAPEKKNPVVNSKVTRELKWSDEGVPFQEHQARMCRDTFTSLMDLMGRWSLKQLQAVVDNPNLPVIQHMVAVQLIKGAKGDLYATNALLDRYQGKAPTIIPKEEAKEKIKNITLLEIAKEAEIVIEDATE